MLKRWTHTSRLSNERAILTDCRSCFLRLGMFRRVNLCGHDRSLFSTLKSKKINQSATTALSLAPSTPDCSLILLLCPSCPGVGHSVSARECQREQSELIKGLPYPRSQEIRCYGDAEISQHARWDSRHGHSKCIYTDCNHFCWQKGRANIGTTTKPNLKYLKTI